MGLTKRKDGYYVEFPVVDDGKVLRLARGTPGAKVKRWKTGTLNKTVAKEQEVLIKTSLMKGEIKSAKIKQITFSEWGEKYLTLDEVKSLRSYRDRVSIIRQQLIPFFRQKLLNEISVTDVEDYRAQRILPNGEHPSLSTVNYDHAVLKHCLGLAERRGLVPSNVAKNVTLPTPDNERDRVLSVEEWERLYVCAAEHLRPILIVAYHLGMRQGEILNLTWDRVDFQRGFIKLRAKDTKAKEGREVPMTRAVNEELRKLSKVRQLHCPFVFLYEGQSIQRVKSSFNGACERAGIKGFRFHDLRHCAATNLRRRGVDTLLAMKIVGHKSEKMHRRYNSISEEDLLQAIRKVDFSDSNTLITPASNVLPSQSVSA